MTRLALLSVLTVPLLVVACAPAPLYTSSGLKRGAATWGEVPRDARGEPVWSAIRPAPGQTAPGATPDSASARSTPAADAAEGDAEATPTPPKA